MTYPIVTPYIIPEHSKYGQFMEAINRWKVSDEAIPVQALSYEKPYNIGTDMIIGVWTGQIIYIQYDYSTILGETVIG